MSLERALELAYRYLSRRERTVAEARGHLSARGIDDSVADTAIATLIQQRYLDDRRFARLFIQDKRELGAWGGERIRRALMERGIEPELAVDALGEQGGYGAELERAIALLRKRMPQPEGGRRGRERALGWLMRRGYEYELASEAIRQHLAASSLAADDRVGSGRAT